MAKIRLTESKLKQIIREAIEDASMDADTIGKEFLNWAVEIADTSKGGWWGNALESMYEYCLVSRGIDQSGEAYANEILEGLKDGFAQYKGVDSESIPTEFIERAINEYSYYNFDFSEYDEDETDQLAESVMDKIKSFAGNAANKAKQGFDKVRNFIEKTPEEEALENCIYIMQRNNIDTRKFYRIGTEDADAIAYIKQNYPKYYNYFFGNL